MPHADLILASSSPYRRELLARLKIPFDVIEPHVDETPHSGETAEALVKRLAIAKAQAVAQNRIQGLVIGSDQVAVHNGRICGKPGNHAEAVRQLQEASGKTITLFTGLALVNTATGRVRCEVVPYEVVFRRLTNTQIERYLHKEQPYGCTGAVRAEGLGVALLERFAGDDPNALIGLPLIRLVRMLEDEGVQVI
jgi:septum formation protein